MRLLRLARHFGLIAMAAAFSGCDSNTVNVSGGAWLKSGGGDGVLRGVDISIVKLSGDDTAFVSRVATLKATSESTIATSKEASEINRAWMQKSMAEMLQPAIADFDAAAIQKATAWIHKGYPRERTQELLNVLPHPTATTQTDAAGQFSLNAKIDAGAGWCLLAVENRGSDFAVWLIPLAPTSGKARVNLDERNALYTSIR